MESNFTKTALILFTRNPEEEAVAKKLAPGFRKKIQQKIFRKLNNQTRHLLSQTGLPVYYISSKNQFGTSFAERLYNAFSAVFSQGFERVIAVGNDCPALTSEIITNAANALLQTEAVFGPDERGGVYLVGFTKSGFNQSKDLLRVRWNTNQVFSDLNQAFNLYPEANHVLPVLADINDSLDFLKSILKRNFPISLLIYFKYLLISQLRIFVFYLNTSFLQSLPSNINFRGPPVYI